MKETPSYTITVSNSDTIVDVAMTKTELMLLRKYIVDLEYDKQQYNLSKKEIKLLNDKIGILLSKESNYLKIIKVSNTTIQSQSEIISSLNDNMKSENKKSYKRGLRTGIGVGGTITLILCLLVL